MLAILYHTVANTFGLSFAPMFSGPDLVRQFWLLAVVNCVLALALALLAGPNLRFPAQVSESPASLDANPSV